MSARFICPHCHASLNPHAMERAYSDLAEYRICPACDEAVFFALRDVPCIPPWLQRSESNDGERAGVAAPSPASAAVVLPECR
ncbi:hypothetical protein [Aromatoleum petrolei]|uniref:Uncharacterized protein n=1 Tax=Aromatoleum petrolei TaxID=76116 RepID=A0ABX1MSC5_9RHOO|nr:hypothetical protein [Aromatoleum petrolei]NMF88017.1 hypothetical protein [Aromatoleum petrolei]QTQ38798.1 Uncharacterized protein ToN1_47040 [Aromatoleum petrolei]